MKCDSMIEVSVSYAPLPVSAWRTRRSFLPHNNRVLTEALATQRSHQKAVPHHHILLPTPLWLSARQRNTIANR